MITENVEWVNAIHQGHALDTLRLMPSASVHCIVTSLPYYMQRDYSTPIQIGNEKSPAEYVRNLKEVFEECRRVLKPDGTFWLNIRRQIS